MKRLLELPRVLQFEGLDLSTLAELMSLMSSDTPLIENILLAASSPYAGISARVADVGFGIVAEAMLAEVCHNENYFEPYRGLPTDVLESGVGGYTTPDAGKSLRMWKHYFRRGLIYGLDVFAKTGIDKSLLQTLQGDQVDEQFLDSSVSEFAATLASIYQPLSINLFSKRYSHACASVALPGERSADGILAWRSRSSTIQPLTSQMTVHKG